jgi:DNA-binding response OmpR family regulator
MDNADPLTPPGNGRGGEHPAGAEEAEPDGLYCTGEVRLLVVDDDAAICRLIQAALTPSGFTVEAVSEPARVEEALGGRPYDVVLLDYVLPGLKPERVLELIREHQPEASIIVVTGYPSIDSALNCLRARTYDYLTKPFQVAHLQQTITRCLQSKGLLRMSKKALRESLGGVIRERRKALGLTLAQLARRSHVSLGYLSQIELGKNSASIETLYQISLGLRMRMSELFQSIQPAV